MEVIFLGTGGYHPNTAFESKKLNACIFLPELRIFIDAGHGFSNISHHIDRLTSVRKEKDAVDLHFLITHSHNDHIEGLASYWDLLNPLYNEKEEVYEIKHHIYCGKETLDSLDTHFFNHKIGAAPRSELPFKSQEAHVIGDLETRATGHTINGAKISAKKFDQRGTEVLAYRIEHDSVVVSYITDIYPSEEIEQEIIDLIEDSDLLIIDTYFDERLKGYAVKSDHGYTKRCAEVAKKANVKKMALVHLNPSRENYDNYLKEACNIFKNTFIPDDLHVENI